MKKTPDYNRIYTDIIARKYPQKKKLCEPLLSKGELSFLDVIHINKLIFYTMDKEAGDFNQKHRSYNRLAILEILEYQKKNRLNNVQLANHFKLSRNTVAKWKKMFLV